MSSPVYSILSEYNSLNDFSLINQTYIIIYRLLLDQGSWWWWLWCFYCFPIENYNLLCCVFFASQRFNWTHERDKSNDPENMRICLISFFIFCITYFYLQLFLASLWPHYNGSLTRPRFDGAAAHLDPPSARARDERAAVSTRKPWARAPGAPVHEKNPETTKTPSVELVAMSYN